MIINKTFDPIAQAALSGIEKLINAVVENSVSEIKSLTEQGGSNQKCLHIACMTASEIEHLTVVSRLIRSNTK